MLIIGGLKESQATGGRCSFKQYIWLKISDLTKLNRLVSDWIEIAELNGTPTHENLKETFAFKQN